MLFRPALIVALTLLLGGCGPNVRVTRLSEMYPPRQGGVEVAVSSLMAPLCPFEEVGLVTVRETLGLNGNAVLEAMKQEALRLGGDALFRLRQIPRSPKEGARGLSATVVRFTVEGCQR